jgi:hypothetical protein
MITLIILVDLVSYVILLIVYDKIEGWFVGTQTMGLDLVSCVILPIVYDIIKGWFVGTQIMGLVMFVCDIKRMVCGDTNHGVRFSFMRHFADRV